MNVVANYAYQAHDEMRLNIVAEDFYGARDKNINTEMNYR